MSNPNGKKNSNIPRPLQQHNARPSNSRTAPRPHCPVHPNVQQQSNTQHAIAKPKSPKSPKPVPSSASQPAARPALLSPENAMLAHLRTEDRLTKLESEIECSRRQEKLRKIQMYEKMKELSKRQLELHRQITLRAENKKNNENGTPDAKNMAKVIKSDAELQDLMRGISESLQRLQKQLQSTHLLDPNENACVSPHTKLENKIRNLENEILTNRRIEKEASVGKQLQNKRVQSKSSTLISAKVRKSVDKTKPQSMESLAKIPSILSKKSSLMEKVTKTKSNPAIPPPYSHRDIQKLIIKLAISLNNVNTFEKARTDINYNLSKAYDENDNWKLLDIQKNTLDRIISAEGFKQYELITEYLSAIYQKKIDQQFQLEMERVLEEKWYLMKEMSKQTKNPDKENKSEWLNRERIQYMEVVSKSSGAMPSSSPLQTKSMQDLSWEWMHREQLKDSGGLKSRADEEVALDIVRLLEQEERILIDEIAKGKWALTKEELKLTINERIENRMNLLHNKISNIDFNTESRKAKNIKRELEQENSKLNRIKIAFGKPGRNPQLVLHFEKKLQYLDDPNEPAIDLISSSPPVPKDEETRNNELMLLKQVTDERQKKEAREAEILKLIQQLEEELNQMKQEDQEWKNQIEKEFAKTHDLRRKLEKQRLIDIAELDKRKTELKKEQSKTNKNTIQTKDMEEEICSECVKQGKANINQGSQAKATQAKSKSILEQTNPNSKAIQTDFQTKLECTDTSASASQPFANVNNCNKPLSPCKMCKSSCQAKSCKKKEMTEIETTDMPLNRQPLVDLEAERVELTVMEPLNAENSPSSTDDFQITKQTVQPPDLPHCPICEFQRLQHEMKTTISAATEIFQSDEILQQSVLVMKDGEMACQTSMIFVASEHPNDKSTAAVAATTVDRRQEVIKAEPETIPEGYNAKPSEPIVRTWFHRHIPTGESEESIRNQSTRPSSRN